MSYADLKPVKFGEPEITYALYDAPASYHNEVYQQPFVSEQVSTYPTLYPLVTEHLHHQPPHQHQPEQHQHVNYHVNLANVVVTSAPPTPTREQQNTFRAPLATPSRKASIIMERDNSKSPADISEEVRNHWMPMTWIERSSDDPQVAVFNFVCLWGNCVSISSSKEEFVQHLYSHLNEVESEIQQGLIAENEIVCQVRGCGKQIEETPELHRHITMHIFQADCQQKGSETLIEKEEYSSIESCGFEPCTNINYDGETLVCLWESCGAPFTSLTDLFEHVSQHIDGVSDIDKVEQDFQNGDKKNVYPCKWVGCTTMADSKSNLRRHARHHSGEKVLACPFCARFFSRRDKLYDHCVRRTILMTEMEDPFLCKLCQKRFGTEKALCMHVTRHLVGHACPLCGLALATRSEIHRHLMTKHSSRTKDYKCDVCSKVFFTESELNRHAVFHSDVMYSCKQCDEKFKWKKQLLKHIKEHDEKFQNFNPTPYTCHLCDRAYTTGFALGRHLTRQHRLQVPYGFSRFTYKKCADGLMRLQTKKLFRDGQVEEYTLGSSVPY